MQVVPNSAACQSRRRPATHAAAAAHLTGQQIPARARLRDEQDARERRTIIKLYTGFLALF